MPVIDVPTICAPIVARRMAAIHACSLGHHGRGDAGVASRTGHGPERSCAGAKLLRAAVFARVCRVSGAASVCRVRGRRSVSLSDSRRRSVSMSRSWRAQRQVTALLFLPSIRRPDVWKRPGSGSDPGSQNRRHVQPPIGVVRLEPRKRPVIEVLPGIPIGGRGPILHSSRAVCTGFPLRLDPFRRARGEIVFQQFVVVEGVGVLIRFI